MNIVVTGGLGFVGTNLVKRLLVDGHKIIVIDDYSIGRIDTMIQAYTDEDGYIELMHPDDIDEEDGTPKMCLVLWP